MKLLAKTKVNLLIFSLAFLSMFAYFAFAAHIITPASLTVAEDVQVFYNITVNNTDAGQVTNITQVNITLPSTFIFTTNTNQTSAGGHIFANTSTVLSWENKTFYLVNGTSVRYFTFNASASTPGNYNITVITLNATSTSTSNISITVNDTTAPSSIEFASPSDVANANLSRGNIVINVSATDNGVISTINIRLFNSTSDQINLTTNFTTSSGTKSLFVNYSGLSDGVYRFNASVNDTYGNYNSTALRNVTIDTTLPVITLLSPASGTNSTTNTYNFTFNVTDTNPISSCSLYFNNALIHTLNTVNNTGGTNGMYNASLSVGIYTWNINCTDYSGNIANSTSRSLIIDPGAPVAATSSGGGGGGGAPTYTATAEKLAEPQGYKLTVRQNFKVVLELTDANHNFVANSIANNKLSFTLSSTPQTASLGKGECGKYTFDNKFYTLQICAESVASNAASVIFKAMSELVPQAPQAAAPQEETTQQQEQEEVQLQPTEESSSSKTAWIVGIIIIVILVVIVIVIHKRRNKSRSPKKFY